MKNNFLFGVIRVGKFNLATSLFYVAISSY